MEMDSKHRYYLFTIFFFFFVTFSLVQKCDPYIRRDVTPAFKKKALKPPLSTHLPRAPEDMTPGFKYIK